MEQQWISALVHNRVKVAVGVILVMLFGVITIFRMPVQLTPEVEVPVVTVTTRWPGASPLEVEQEIIHEQEEQLKQVEGVRKMTSECTDSQGRITLEFEIGTDISEALLRVSTRLQQVREYPEDAEEPVISTSGISDRPIAWFVLTPRVPPAEQLRETQRRFPALAAHLDRVLQAPNPGLALARLRALAAEHPELSSLVPPPELNVNKMRKFVEDVVEARFERVPGVANANTLGGQLLELQVIVDPHKLAARRLTIQDLREALRRQNQDISGGDFWEGKRRYVVRTLGQFRSPEDVGHVVIAYRDGAPVYVADVATAQLGYRKPDGVVRRFGDYSIAVNVERATGANVLTVMKDLKKAAEELNRNVLHPQGLELTQVYDETEYILSAIGMVTNNIYSATLLTTLVLLIFLRSLRSTLVLALAIPVSVLGAFLIMGMLGRTLNVISLAGLAFAVGMLVDNSIVVLENIYRHYQNGLSPLRAAVRGTSEVWGAVLASTLTTLAVFLPVLFVKEEAGQLFRDIALAISGSVGLSLIVAVTVIPAVSSKLLVEHSDTSSLPEGVARRGQDGQSVPPSGSRRAPVVRRVAGLLGMCFPALLHPLLAFLDAIGSSFVRAVLGLNRWALPRTSRRLALIGLLVSLSVGLSYALLPKVEYLPTGNRNLVIGMLLPPPGYNLEELMQMGQRIEDALKPYWDYDSEDSTVYQRPYPPIEDFFYVARGRQVFVGLRSADPSRVSELVPLVQEAIRGFPGTLSIVRQTSLFERGLTAGRTIDVEIAGPHIEKLLAVGARVLGLVQEVLPGCQAIPEPSLDLSSPEVHVVPQREKAAEVGLSAAELGYAVDALVDGAYADDYFIGGQKVDLRILGPIEYKGSSEELYALPIATARGDILPLGAVASVQLGSGPEEIRHRERQRAITVTVSPPAEIPLEEAMNRIETQVVKRLRAEGLLGDDVQIFLAGTADKLREAWAALRFNVVLASLITYLLMAALFESWVYPLVVMFTVPLGAVGGFALLKIVNLFTLQPLDVITMLGFIILIGTVVNNAILVVEQALIHVRYEGMDATTAILESVRTRIRPIFMTTLTTVIGLFPLVVMPGAGSELYRGLGAIVLGGLCTSTFFTLVVTPNLLSLTWSVQDWVARVLGRWVPQLRTVGTVGLRQKADSSQGMPERAVKV